MYVPWKDHPGEPRFICDVMTEGLAKQLRLYGVDAAAVQTKGKGSRHLVYRLVPYYSFTWRMSFLSVHLYACMAWRVSHRFSRLLQAVVSLTDSLAEICNITL